ncbi:hypothetical protein [Anaerotignum sp.]|uniref:hypothetical protein n=1 Tax=Anaerotignum sp. TaxID=2039241 RepID=UPI00289F35D2|nr:hypothetical protein [Anaerotignum sp.]
MGNWINPNDNILRMRLTEAQYAESFIEHGTVKFNIPDFWVNYAEQFGDGRGDFYEGTLAFCHYLDSNTKRELSGIYSTTKPLNPKARNLLKKKYKQRILFKDKRTMQLPCLCLYILKVDAFDSPQNAGEQILKTTIPGSYFRDFVDNKPTEYVEKQPLEKQPALIIIKDFDLFKKRMIKALMDIGVNENEIIIGYVRYYDFEKYGCEGWYDFGQAFPKELFVKNSRFSDQKEGRVIVNTRNKEVLERLKKPINLGNMSDISQICKGYYPDGIDIKVTATVVKVKVEEG